MATSSFTENFILTPEAAKKIAAAPEHPGVLSKDSYKADRLKEGREALARFSPRSKK